MEADDLADLLDEEDEDLISEYTPEEFQKELLKYPKVRDKGFKGDPPELSKQVYNLPPFIGQQFLCSMHSQTKEPKQRKKLHPPNTSSVDTDTKMEDVDIEAVEFQQLLMELLLKHLSKVRNGSERRLLTENRKTLKE